MKNKTDSTQSQIIYQVSGMTCTGCESLLIKNVSSLKDVDDVQADHISGRVKVTLQNGALQEAVSKIIEKAGYEVTSIKVEIDSLSQRSSAIPEKPWMRWSAIILFMFLGYQIIKRLDQFVTIPELSSQVSYGILFVIGFLTSLHCITMCGGIAMSQCISENKASTIEKRLRPSLLYNAGRVTSYTIIGGVIGAVGSIISITLRSQGIIIIVAGLFMIIMGLNLLNLFPFLKWIIPSLPRGLSNFLSNHRQGKGPYVVGLINGIMPCGPLQTIQLYALGTGSFITGATSMFFFSLGTVPLMFALGAVSALVSQRFNKRMFAASGLLVMVLGTVMISRGLSLTGTVAPSLVPVNYTNVAIIENDRQFVKIELEPYNYEPIVVQVGIPVAFIIEAEQSKINGCNNAFVIPAYNLQDNILAGENIYEFLPTEVGTVSYACWMGMIRSSIQIVDDIAAISPLNL